MAKVAAKGVDVPEFRNPPRIPRGWAYIWEIFLLIHAERDSAWGVQHMKIRDIVGACRAYGVELNPVELEAIRAVDREFVAAHGGNK